MKNILSLLFVAALTLNNLSAQILVSTGSGGNYDISAYPGNFTGYYDGFSLIFRANHNNPASYAKMRIGAFSQVDIYNTAGNALSAGDIKSNQIITLVYDASTSRFQMVTTSGNVGGGGGISGSGTASYLTRWATASTLGNSTMFDDGSSAGIGTTSPESKLHIVIPTGSGNQLQLGHNNQPTREWRFDVDASANMSLVNEGNGIPFSATFWENTGKTGFGTTSPLMKLDVRGSNAKGATFIYENIFQVASNEATSPLALRMGIQTSSTVGNRYGAIEVDDGGIKRSLELQPNGGNVGIGTMSGTGTTLNVTGPSAYFYNPSGGMNFSIQGSLFNGSSLFVDGQIKINVSTPGANAILALKDGHIQTQQGTAPTYTVNPSNATSATITGTDVAGQISYFISGSATTGSYVTFIFNKPYASPPVVILTPQNAIAAAAYSGHDVFVTSNSTSFTIFHNVSANLAPIISSATASFHYMVMDR